MNAPTNTDTIPAAASTEPAAQMAPDLVPDVWIKDLAAWFRNDVARPHAGFGAMFRPELGHQGPCYVGRIARSAWFPLVLTVGGTLCHAAGRQLRSGEFVLDLGVGASVLLVSLLVVGGGAVWRHMRWHRVEAFFLGSEIGGEDHRG
ncbi:hypothetical protein [Micromonospora sp. NPDC049662]|uniref:hypothetical protein n=1 Tax=Micromonospora sp. NPDC049662 TaxID=3155397 RepID=UPI003424D392